MKNVMTSLIDRHYGELQFDLRLRFKIATVLADGTVCPAGHYVAESGPVETANMAIFFTCGPAGESRRFVIRWFTEESDVAWLREVPERNLELQSDLGEM